MKQLREAIQIYKQGNIKLFKYVSLSDAGKTGGHQAGLHVPRSETKFMFDESVKRGENKHKNSTINWFDGRTSSNCKFIYYGRATRDEFRITCINRKFEVNDLVIMVLIEKDTYRGFILSDEAEIAIFKEEIGEE